MITIVSKDIMWISSSDGILSPLFNFLGAGSMDPNLCTSSFEITQMIITKDVVSAENYGECVDLLLNYPSSAASLFASGIVPGSQSRNSKDGSGASKYAIFSGC